jgi:hypothetical protein
MEVGEDEMRVGGPDDTHRLNGLRVDSTHVHSKQLASPEWGDCLCYQMEGPDRQRFSLVLNACRNGSPKDE